jgi:hypothetical protein
MIRNHSASRQQQYINATSKVTGAPQSLFMDCHAFISINNLPVHGMQLQRGMNSHSSIGKSATVHSQHASKIATSNRDPNRSLVAYESHISTQQHP